MRPAERFLRTLAVAAIAVWLGGVVFYGAVAVPSGVKVFHGHREIGFLTREVTDRANWIGVLALLVLLANFMVGFRGILRGAHLHLAVSWGVMAASHIALMLLWSAMDGLLGGNRDMAIHSPDDLARLHPVYLGVTSVQCMAGALHLWGVLQQVKPAPAP